MKNKFKYNYKLHFISTSLIFTIVVLSSLFVYADFDKLLFEIFGTEQNRSNTLSIFLATHIIILFITLGVSICKYEENKN